MRSQAFTTDVLMSCHGLLVTSTILSGGSGLYWLIPTWSTLVIGSWTVKGGCVSFWPITDAPAVSPYGLLAWFRGSVTHWHSLWVLGNVLKSYFMDSMIINNKLFLLMLNKNKMLCYMNRTLGATSKSSFKYPTGFFKVPDFQAYCEFSVVGLTWQEFMFENGFFDEIVRHQLCAVDQGVPRDVRQSSCIHTNHI